MVCFIDKQIPSDEARMTFFIRGDTILSNYNILVIRLLQLNSKRAFRVDIEIGLNFGRPDVLPLKLCRRVYFNYPSSRGVKIWL